MARNAWDSREKAAISRPIEDGKNNEPRQSAGKGPNDQHAKSVESEGQNQRRYGADDVAQKSEKDATYCGRQIERREEKRGEKCGGVERGGI